MPIRIPDRLPARDTLDQGRRDGDGRVGGDPAGHPPAAHRPAQPDAEQDRDRNADRAADRLLAAAGGTEPHPHRQPQGEEHLGRASDFVLPDLRGGAAREIRRLHHYRRADRDAALRRRDLLERDARDLRLDAQPMSIRPFSSAGARWRRSTISTACPSMRCRRRRSASTGTATSMPASPYLAGFSDDFSISVSRWTEVRREDLKPASGP